MKTEHLFSIGEISRLCGISVVALRHYDKIGVIKPVYIDSESKYRYYDEDTILSVVILRYYQKLGFPLERIPSLLERRDLGSLKNLLLRKNGELEEEIRMIVMRQASLTAWVQLINEANAVLRGECDGVFLRLIERTEMMYCDPEFHSFTKFKHFLASADFSQETTAEQQISYGPLYIAFPSVSARLSGDYRGIRQYIHRHEWNRPTAKVEYVGGWQGITAYHKHGFESICETYAMMENWAEEHRFTLRGDALERYVIDYWSSSNESCFVTEIMLPLAKE